MVKKLLSLIAVALFTLSLVGSVLAADIRGRITKVENDGRLVCVTPRGGEEVCVRVSGSGTTLEGVGDRSEFKEGQRVNVTYDENDDRKTASKIAIRAPRK